MVDNLIWILFIKTTGERGSRDITLPSTSQFGFRFIVVELGLLLLNILHWKKKTHAFTAYCRFCCLISMLFYHISNFLPLQLRYYLIYCFYSSHIKYLPHRFTTQFFSCSIVGVYFFSLCLALSNLSFESRLLAQKKRNSGKNCLNSKTSCVCAPSWENSSKFKMTC